MPAALTARPPKKTDAQKPRKLSRNQKPAEMSLEDWQIALRREFGRAQDFELRNLGNHAVFSDFAVTNPQSGRTYRIAVRGQGLGDSRCTCPDFATNTLGTCKHVEFTLEQLRRKRGGKSALRRGWAPTHGEIWLRYGAQRHVVFRAGHGAPGDVHQLAARYFGADGTLRDSAFPRFERFLEEAAQLGHAVTCDPEALDFIAHVRDATWREAVIEEKYVDPAQVDALVKTTLYPYQRDGVLFAAAAGRALIGDEMGLGKTVQAVALAELMAREFGVERVLIVCPSSLKHQWKQEIDRFTDRSATVVEGLTHARRAQYVDESFFKIVNYDVIHRDLEAIARMDPDLVILDEAQRIKNWRTRAAQAVKSIASPYALVLTGTPLENRLEELHSIVQFVDQHRLGPLFRFLHNHQVREGDTSRVIGYQNLSRIGETLRPILLRRRKREVLEQLPGRADKTFFVPMTPEQRNIHSENQEIVAKLVQRWRRNNFLSESDQRRLTIALLRMRMSCDNTYLVDHQTRFGPKLAELEVLLGEIFEDPEAKVVIFSQWTRMNDLVAEMLEARGWDHVYLHGGVPSRDRKHLLAKFREPGVRVFLSTDAGGVGLNLQQASVVVNLDLPWNPAVLEQRIGRVYRLGQRRPVNVFNFVAEGTIEHGMINVLSFKKELFTGVLDGGEDAISLGGSRLKKFMDSVEAVSGAVPQAAPLEEEPEDTVELAAGPVLALPLPVVADAPREAEAVPGREADAVPAHPASHSPEPSGAGPAATWQPLLEVGAAFLRDLAASLGNGGAPPPAEKGGASGAPRVAVERDPETGRACLKVALPEPEALQALATAAAPLLELLKGMVK